MKDWKRPLENPVSALFLLGTCPALAACDTFWNALLIAAATVVVFDLTNAVLYLLRGVAAGAARLAALLVTASALSGIAVLLVEAYFPAQYEAVGLYIPLTALQCAALDRVLPDAETPSGLSKLVRPLALYVLTLCAVGLLRELLGAGTAFGVPLLPSGMEALAFFRSVPGAFLTLAFVAMGAKAAGLFREEAPQ